LRGVYDAAMTQPRMERLVASREHNNF
jgi:hypothetical protein